MISVRIVRLISVKNENKEIYKMVVKGNWLETVYKVER